MKYVALRLPVASLIASKRCSMTLNDHCEASWTLPSLVTALA
jgi:hypothetical protein